MFTGKVCVVTNGAKGIGGCIVEEFAKKGCDVAFIDIDLIAGRRLLEHIRNEYGVNAFFFHGDIRSEIDLEIFAKGIIEQYKRVDFFINNACFDDDGLIKSDKIDQLYLPLQVGLISPYLLISFFKENFSYGAALINILEGVEEKEGKQNMLISSVQQTVVAMTKEIADSFDGSLRANCIRMGNYRETAGELVGDRFDLCRAVMLLCEKKGEFINGNDIIVDERMTKTVMYRGEDGWSFLNKK